MEVINCWEFMKCGKETTCIAATEIRLDKVHRGKNAGRACWIVAGSLCVGKATGVFVEKIKNCLDCSFYIKVKVEEEANFQHGKDLYSHLK
jgi:hypothetical protein